jgi:hypothetical protein
MPSREGENGFVPGRLCFVGGVGTKQSYFALWEYRLAWPRGGRDQEFPPFIPVRQGVA